MKIEFPENIFAPEIGKDVPVANLPDGIELNPGDVYKLIDLYRAKGAFLTESESLSVINVALSGPTKEVRTSEWLTV